MWHNLPHDQKSFSQALRSPSSSSSTLPHFAPHSILLSPFFAISWIFSTPCQGEHQGNNPHNYWGIGSQVPKWGEVGRVVECPQITRVIIVTKGRIEAFESLVSAQKRAKYVSVEQSGWEGFRPKDASSPASAKSQTES